MPLTRYQIRSEYSLADPELYRAADTDDPESLLEGVAMAGLVGVLRQLGDLAEFAAEIFHGLLEEVMATAARDHRLMIRVQQLEVEIPSIEKGFLSQTSHSLFLYNAGIDWHPNLRMDQNLITRENLPRFVMDSYEECRGPPRLFLLDKFDIGGAGACLKRYSDPSFFKPELTSPETMKTDVQREKKARKIKRKGTRWRNRETPEMMPTSHAKLHQLFLEKDSQIENNVPINRVKLKKRQLDEPSFDSTIGKSYMVRFLEILSPERKVVCGSSINPPRLKRKSNNNIESGNAIQEISTWSPPKKLLQRQRIPDSSCSNQETVLEPFMNELDQDAIMILEKVLEPMADVGVGKIPSTLCKVEDQKKPVIDGERKTEASVDGYRSDDIASEMNNYTDSLATVESQMENERDITNIKRRGMDSGPSEEQKELQARFSVSNSFGNSSTLGDGNNLFKKGSCCFSYSDTLSNLADNSLSDGDVAVKVYPSTKYFPVDAVDISAKNLSTNKDILETKSSEFVVINSGCNEVSEIPNNGSEFRETSSNSCATDVTSTLSHLNPGRSLSEVQSAEPEMTEISSVCMKAGTVESSSNIEYGKYLGGDLACMTNGSNFPSKMRDDSLSTGSARSLPLEELDGRIIESVTLLHLSNISNLSLENKEDDNALAVVLPTEYTKDSSSTENLIKGKLDSPHSVTLPAEDQSYGLAEQDQETCSSTTSLPEFLSVSITPGDLDAIESDGMVVELDNVIPSIGDNSEYLTSVLDILESGNFAGQDSPEITDKVLPLELDSVESGVKRLSNSPDVMHISTTEAKDGLDSNEVSSLDSMGKGAASLGFSSGCIVSDSPKPISETEVNLHAENFVTGIVHTEAVYDGTIVGPSLIGSPSRNCIKLQEECLSIHGESDQHELEFSEASSPNDPLESDDPKEANGLEDSSTCLSFDSFDPNYHDPTCSELLDLHDLLLVGHTQNHLPLSVVTGSTASSKESKQELEPKCSHQNLAENLEDESSPVHAIPELRVPLEKASKLQVDQPNVESLHEGAVTPESSDLHSEQTQSPKYLDQDGCFNTPSESFAVDPLSHLSEPEFAPLPTSHDFASLGTVLDPSDSVFPSSGQQLLELHLSRSVLEFPSATPNVVQANMEEMPLLPPLPPMQWRIGKLQDGSPASEGEMVQPRLNTFTPLLLETADEKAQWSFRTLDQPLNPFLPLSAIEDEKPQRGSETLFGEMVWSSLSPFSSALSATVSDENSQRGFLSLEGAIMQSVIPFLPSPAIEPVKSKHASPTLEEETAQPTFNLFSPFPTIEDVKPRHFSPLLQGELEQPVNLLAPAPNTEHKKAQQNSSTLEGDMMQPLNSSAPPLTMEDEKAQHGSPNFMGETAWPVEDGKPNVSFRMRHRRPRGPLIEAVASHDKSVLRKVMEFTRPINGPKEDERDSLLEQIRAKSFNLRPAVKTKPSIQGPKTNLKIAAILEKANAIRQALAGSDEDDDGDSWSDS